MKESSRKGTWRKSNISMAMEKDNLELASGHQTSMDGALRAMKSLQELMWYS